MERKGLLPIEKKIFSLTDFLIELNSWKEEGDRIVFTNGCFDLLHKGHIYLLAEAKLLGNRLIVGLNSDSSVTRLKGNGRPIQNESDRALLLAALNMVDAVILFGEDTPKSLIETIMPDVLAKGGDYSLEEIVGYDYVTGNGGEVIAIPYLDGKSTTLLEQRLKNS